MSLFGLYIGGFTLVKNRIFSQLPRVGKQWYLSFDVKPTGTIRSSSNIVHATIGKDSERFGDRIPAVWFRPGRTELSICSAVNDQKNYCWTSRALPLNKFTNVRIRQVWNPTLHVYEFIVELNDVVVHKVVNNGAESFDNVLLYASNPWNVPAKAVVRHLVFQNLPNGKLDDY